MSEQPEPLPPILDFAKVAKRSKLELEPTTTLDPKFCRHVRTLVDEHARKIQCALCHVDLDPISVLARLSREESNLRELTTRYQQERVDIESRTRFQCAHCRRFTRVEPGARNHKINPDGTRGTDA
jgi:hypothetical protein